MILLGVVVAVSVAVGAAFKIWLLRETRGADRRQAEWLRTQSTVEVLSPIPIVDESARERATVEAVAHRRTA